MPDSIKTYALSCVAYCLLPRLLFAQTNKVNGASVATCWAGANIAETAAALLCSGLCFYTACAWPLRGADNSLVRLCSHSARAIEFL